METIFEDERYLIVVVEDCVVGFTKTGGVMTESFVLKKNSGEINFIEYILNI